MNDDNRTPRPAPVNNLELKAALLLALFVALVAASRPRSAWCWWPTIPRACASAWT
jgi:hypothetical protein